MPATNTTIATGKTAAHAITLTAATVDTVTFTDDVATLEIIKHDTVAAIYYTVGTVNDSPAAPTVGGSHTRVLPNALCVDRLAAPGGSPPVVKLISSGAAIYSVQGT